MVAWMRIKPGDMVRVRSLDNMIEEYGCNQEGDPCTTIPFTKDMRTLCGSLIRVEYVRTYDANICECEIANCGYEITTEMVERLDGKSPMTYQSFDF